MAELVKLQRQAEGGESITLYPITPPQAVIDPTSGISTREELDNIKSEYLTKLEAEDTYQPIGDYKIQKVLTQSEYDQLEIKDEDTIYIITDNDTGVVNKVVYEAQTLPIDAMSGDTVIDGGDSDDNITDTLNGGVSTGLDVTLDITTKQDVLVSGTNIKTINSQSILGYGNIEISQDLSSYITTEQADSKYQEKGEYATSNELNKVVDSIDTLNEVIVDKQDTLTPGNNITIVDNTISANVPTTTSELTNDSGYITSDDIPNATYITKQITGKSINDQGVIVDTSADEYGRVYSVTNMFHAPGEFILYVQIQQNELHGGYITIHSYDKDEAHISSFTWTPDDIYDSKTFIPSNDEYYFRISTFDCVSVKLIPSDSVTQEELQTTVDGINQSLTEYAKTTDIPTNVSQLANDSNYQTSNQVTTSINNRLPRIEDYNGNMVVLPSADFFSSVDLVDGDVYIQYNDAGYIQASIKNFASSEYAKTGYPIQSTSDTTISMNPNVYYKISGTPTAITLTFNSKSTTNMEEYLIEFTTSSSGCTLAVPSSVKWMNGEAPSLEVSSTYQISIVNNLAVYGKFN